ncbi:unnamed protein product [Cuscuta europaea]|uniref:Uncharacterized protein n=1 Tax=Cuscuta europaea TaxID=41803 RepID=A0A9P0ZWV5_CUSEU|nr:unnamed protein product [Cuscuta europaea]
MFRDIIFACALDGVATGLEIATGVFQSNKVRNAVKDPSSSTDCYAGTDVIIFWIPLLVVGCCGVLAHLIACKYGRRIYRNRDPLPDKQKTYAILFAIAACFAFGVGISMIVKGFVVLVSGKEVRYSNGHCSIVSPWDVVITAFAWFLHGGFVGLAYYTFRDVSA